LAGRVTCRLSTNYLITYSTINFFLILIIDVVAPRNNKKKKKKEEEEEKRGNPIYQ
jgi:hypothetical protein